MSSKNNIKFPSIIILVYLSENNNFIGAYILTFHTKNMPPAIKKKEQLTPASEEQQIILDHLKEGDNVIVDACAGSGKSTTILSAAKQMYRKHFLLITYNSMLREEISNKVNLLEMKNIEVHTFHSLCKTYYYKYDYTDSGIRKTLDQNLPPIKPLPKMNILVLDEAQDISQLYYHLVVKMSFNYAKPFQILILGDYKQSLYEFKGSDTRFLTRADNHWALNPFLKSKLFHCCSLQTSYRITRPMASFVNNVMLGEERLVSVKNGTKVIYIRRDIRSIKNFVCFKIRELIREGESPGEIFVLGGSTKRPDSLIRQIENSLVEIGIPCYMPTSIEADKLDPKVIDNKVVFTTYHSVKGRQRKYVFVADFNHNYMKFHGRDLPTDICPNTIYVACTRATHTLYLLESSHYSFDRPFKFLKKSLTEIKNMEQVEFMGLPQSIFTEEKEMTDQQAFTHRVNPTDLLAFLGEDVLSLVTPTIDRIFTLESSPLILDEETEEYDIPSTIKTSLGFHEDVSDINGIAIPSIYYDHLSLGFKDAMEEDGEDNTEDSAAESSPVKPTGTHIIQELIMHKLQTAANNKHTFLQEMVEQHMPKECTSYADYLYLTNLFIAVNEKIYFKLKQIPKEECNWLTDAAVNRCLDVLTSTIGEEIRGHAKPYIEYTIVDYHCADMNETVNNFIEQIAPDIRRKFIFSARPDIITHDNIWEIKCTSQLVVEHKLQLVMYAWLWRVIYEPRGYHARGAKLINIKTGERWRMEASLEQLTEIVVSLLRYKYIENGAKKTDEEFDNDMAKIMNIYVELLQKSKK